MTPRITLSMIFAVLILLWGIVSGNYSQRWRNPAQIASVSETRPLTVQEVRDLGYFNRLGYDDPSFVEQAPSLEAKLIASADIALTLPNDDPYLQKNALVFIYAALFMDNILEARGLGLYPLLEESEVRSREDKILQYVDRAKELMPNDARMDSWVIGMKAKHVGPEYASKLVEMVRERKDTFSLISALTVTRNMRLTVEEQAVLSEQVEKFTSLSSPCFAGKTKSQCHSTALAPFAAQTGVIMMADYRLKTTKNLSSQRKKNIGRILTRILYYSTHMVWMKESTPTWRYASIIPERIELTRKAAFSEAGWEDYWKTPNARVIYKCTSCHASAITDAGNGPVPSTEQFEDFESFGATLEATK